MRRVMIVIPRIPLIPTNYLFWFIKRHQFPMKVWFAVTINMAPGEPLKMVGVDLSHDCFSHGQLYVACSWASSADIVVIPQP